MGVIAAVEDALLAEVGAALGKTIRQSGSLPGGWTHDSLQRALQFAPGVFVGFSGMTAGQSPGYQTGRFAVYAVTKGAVDTDRRRGTARVAGAYDLLETLLPRLERLEIADIGVVRVRSVDNLFRDAMFDLGGAVYAVQLELPNLPFDYRADAASLDDFATFDAVYDINEPIGSGEPEANDHLTGLDTP